jgi:glycosyltransferase involved in cell wall biosynthesis
MREPMKVFYLLDNLGVGGAETSLLGILRHFQKTEPVVCHIHPENAMRPAFEQAGIRVIGLDVNDKYPFVRGFWRVVQALQQQNPDLIHVAGFYSSFIGRAAGRLFQIPVIGSFNSMEYNSERFERLPRTSRWKLGLMYKVDRMTFSWISHVIAISETARDHNAKIMGVSTDRISVIYRGRDPQVFQCVEPTLLCKLREALSIPRESPIILNVGRLVACKGQEDLVHAMSSLLQTVPQAKLLITGEGYYRSKLESEVRKLEMEGSIRLLGTRGDVPALLGLADVFVFPSHYEGFGGALVEAMFAAKPIVATDIAVIRESITVGQTGILVPAQDPAALAQAIGWMLEHPEEARVMGERARQVALERFHIERVSVQHENVYEQLLQQWRAAS